MTDRTRANQIAVLEQVRGQLEASLGADAKWRALKAGIDGSAREEREKEFADSPIYKSWKLVNEAIDNLRSITGESSGAHTMDQWKGDSNNKPDNLTSIRGIDAALAQRLAALGATRYAQIAAWSAEDVRKFSQGLKLGREISRQNWIEQAALLQHRKESSDGEVAASQAHSVQTLAPEPREDERVAQSPPDRIDLPQIIQAIRKEDVAHADTPPRFTFEAASEAPREPADVAREVPSAAVGEQITAPPLAGVALSLVAQDKVTGSGEHPAPRRPKPQGSRIPTVVASAHVNTEATERRRQLAEARRELARSVELAESEGLRNVDEAVVTFVIREPMRADAQSRGLRIPSAGPASLDRARDVRAREDDTASYVTSVNPPEEAEVVVVKANSRSHYGSVKRMQGGAVRRFLKTLTGG